MNIRFVYGPAGGYLTGGTAASAQRIATMEQHAAGTKTIDAAYTAKTSGTNYFRYYRYAVNGGTGTSYSAWSFYVRQITFDSQGGSAIESQLVWDRNNAAVYCTAVKPTDPTRTGHTFGGWYTDAACTDGNKFDFTAQIRANTTLYAKWTVNTYNVAYHLTNPDGSAYAPAEAVTKYTYGQGLTLPAPAQEGYTFYGWYGNSSYTGMTYTSVAKTATGDKEYYGYFKDTQKPDISIVGYQNTDGSDAADSWLRASGVSAPIIVAKAEDNAGVTGLLISVDGAAYSSTGISSQTGSTYEIQVSDGEGNTGTYIYTVGEQGEIPFLLPVTDGGTIDLCGKEIVLVKKGDGSNTTDSGEQSLTIVARPSAPQGTVTPELAADMDDAVINITVDGGGQHEGKKEYSTDGQTTWMDVPDDDIIKDLAPGDVCIRMKATEDAPRGETGTITVTPSSNKIKIEFALNYAGASAPSAQEGLTCKEYLNKPQDPSRGGYDFTGWYKSAACEENGRWRFEESEAGAPNVVGDIIDKTQENYKDKYAVEAGVITVTLYAGWRENVKPQLSAVLMKDDEEKDENDWHRDLFIAVTYSDNVGVAKLYAKTDDGAYTELEISGTVQNGTDTEGNTQYRFPYDSLLEGEHSYTFKAVDEAGNETETEVTAKLDKTKPVLGEADFNEGYKNLWDWIIRKDSLTVTIPVTETGSGIADVEYILTPDGQSAGGDTGKAEVRKSSDGSAGYTATFGIAPDYKGKVIITAIDKAGNRSDEKTIGADGSGMNGVIVEDNAPVITILADRDITDEAGTQPDGTALSEAYYNTAPVLLVKVQDNEAAGSEVVTAGLAAVSWKIGDGRDHSVNADFMAAIKTSHSFTISELESKVGSLTVTVSAVDQAGNEAYKTVTVHIKEREAVPRPGIDYIQEKLTGLEPNAPYGIGADVITADAQGRIEIKEEWFDSEIQIYRKGGESTLDSESAGVSIAARPAAPSVTKKNDETIKGKKDGAVSGVDAAMEYSTDSGRTWTALKDSDITQDGAADFASGEIWIRVKATETAPHGYAETVEIGAGRTLTVTFVSNGGSSVSAITGKSWNDTVTSPQPPTREGYAFEGWYREEGCTTIWHFAPAQEGSDIDRLVDDVTLYAKWRDSAKPSISAALTDNKDGENWYQTLSFALTYSDNENGTELYVKRDNGEYIELETSGSTESGQDADGNTRYQLIYENLQEGEHSYTFKAVDMAGNEAETDALTARLDTTKPALGEASFNEGYTNIWHWNSVTEG